MNPVKLRCRECSIWLIPSLHAFQHAWPIVDNTVHQVLATVTTLLKNHRVAVRVVTVWSFFYMWGNHGLKYQKSGD